MAVELSLDISLPAMNTLDQLPHAPLSLVVEYLGWPLVLRLQCNQSLRAFLIIILLAACQREHVPASFIRSPGGLLRQLWFFEGFAEIVLLQELRMSRARRLLGREVNVRHLRGNWREMPPAARVFSEDWERLEAVGFPVPLFQERAAQVEFFIEIWHDRVIARHIVRTKRTTCRMVLAGFELEVSYTKETIYREESSPE